MKNTARLLTVLVMSLGLMVVSIGEADAKRFGGGRSLGGKSAFSNLFKRSPSKARSPSQEAAFNKNQAARQQLGQRGGLMGMVGGLMLGGLLGALFFGGAFENLNFMDILVFAGIAFLLYKLLAAKRKPQAQAAGGYRFDAGDDDDRRVRTGGQARESITIGSNLAGGAGPQSGGADADFDGDPAPRAGPVPASFNEKEFLAGATRAFEILQQSWNDGDLSEIRGLTTDAMFALIQEQHNEAGADQSVEVLEVSAKLLDVRAVSGHEEATVMFDAIMREARNERPSQVREVWHFERKAGARTPNWFLDGIQQLED